MRLASLALAFLSAAPAAHAATIEGETAMGCRDLAFQRRLDTVAGAGDREGVTALVREALASGQCRPLKAGDRVRIEENAFPYACVASFGSAGACLWVRQRNVNPTN